MPKQNRKRQLLKTFILNLMTLCTLLIMVNIAAITIYNVSRWFVLDGREQLPNYGDGRWASQHFTEFANISRDYFAFIGWRSREFFGETINIDDRGRRLTLTNNSAPVSVYFFGGSTVWGTGLSDEQTIPSSFSDLEPNSRVTNWAESSYTAHQGLEELMRVYALEERPDVVIFVDGVNDVAVKCRRELNWYSHALENEFRAHIRSGAQLELIQLLGPARSLVEKLIEEFVGSDSASFDCATDEAKRVAVASALVRDWELAKLIVESWGGKFYAFLQPVAYLSETRLEYLNLDEELGDQYRAVYPLIREQILKRKNMIDISDSLDRDAYLYIDFCHFSEPAGRYIAQAIQRSIPSL